MFYKESKTPFGQRHVQSWLKDDAAARNGATLEGFKVLVKDKFEFTPKRPARGRILVEGLEGRDTNPEDGNYIVMVFDENRWKNVAFLPNKSEGQRALVGLSLVFPQVALALWVEPQKRAYNSEGEPTDLEDLDYESISRDYGESLEQSRDSAIEKRNEQEHIQRTTASWDITTDEPV